MSNAQAAGGLDVPGAERFVLPKLMIVLSLSLGWALGGCAHAKARTPPDDAFIFESAGQRVEIRDTSKGLEGSSFVYLRDGEWMRHPLANVHLGPSVVESRSGAHVDLKFEDGMHLSGYWFECPVDLVVNAQALKGSFCGESLSLVAEGERYGGEVRRGTYAAGVSLRVPGVVLQRPPSELALGLIVGLQEIGPAWDGFPGHVTRNSIDPVLPCNPRSPSALSGWGTTSACH